MPGTRSLWWTRNTGELREAQIFVAVLGASNYTYAEATWTQTLPDWIASHVRAFEFYGGCSELLISGQPSFGGEPGAPLRARHQPHLPTISPAITRWPCFRLV